MKKVLFIISNDLFIRNYISTGVIDSLNKKYDCKIIASEKLFNKEEVENLESFIGYYRSHPSEDRRRFFMMDVILWRYRKRSTTFIYRFMRISGLHDLNIFSSLTNFREFLSILKRNPNKNRKLIIYRIIFGNPFIFNLFIYLYKRRMTLNKYLKKYLDLLKPDLILFPSSAYDPIAYDIIEYGIKKKIKIALLIDNWDNLSSKTVFLKRPNFLTVWGQQSLEHAIKIHGFKKEQIILIGTPRFDIYYETRGNPPKSPISGKYVLFTGACLEMDETGALKELEEELEQNKNIYGDLKIIYRPHPWRQGKNDFNESDFKHIELDMQLKNHYLRLKKIEELGKYKQDLGNFQPELNYYPAILGNSLFIVSPLTTMALEALIMKKKVLLIVYDDGKNFTTPKNVFMYYEHFRGIENLNGFNFCKEKSKLRKHFREIYLNMSRDNIKSVESDLNYFLFTDNRKYEQRLIDAIDYMIKSPKRA